MVYNLGLEKQAYIKKKFKFIYFERQSVKAHMGEEQRESDRERIPSRLHNVSREPNVGLELMNQEIMTWAEIKLDA